MQIYRTSLYLFRITLDIIVLILSIIVSAYITLTVNLNMTFAINTRIILLILALSVIWYFSAKVIGVYDEFHSRDFVTELILVIKNIFVQSVAAMMILFLVREEYLTRYFVFMFTLVLLISLTYEKYILRRILIFLRKKGRNLRSLLIIGAGEVGRNFLNTVHHNPHFGYRVVGFLDDEKKSFLNGQYLGKIRDLDDVLNNNEIDNVIVALPNYANDKVEDVIRTCEMHTTRVKIIPDYFKYISNRYDITMFGPFPLIAVRDDRLNELHWRMLKRSFDFMFSLLLFIFVFSWLWPVLGILIKITSPGHVFFKQERWGRNNKKFIAYKFRSMKDDITDIDENGKFRQVTKDDPRVTKIGRFLRKTNLDELPQFWNVLKGDMSIVGPRPHPTPLNLESKNKVRLYMFRHLVKPGITGWAQVNGFRGETGDISLMQQRIDFDIWYIENWTFKLDMQIILTTIWKMIKGDPQAY